jgi:hypothetical protein
MAETPCFLDELRLPLLWNGGLRFAAHMPALVRLSAGELYAVELNLTGRLASVKCIPVVPRTTVSPPTTVAMKGALDNLVGNARPAHRT